MVGWLNKRTIAYLCALGALATYYMVWPVWRAQYPLEIWFTESWNAYHQDVAAAGLRLYPGADQLVVNNYPPLSFYAIGWLGKLFGDNLFVGRAISIVGLLAIAVEIALAVRLLAGSLIAGSLGALWFIAIMAHNATSYVGANDPQIAALAIMGAGLVWFLARDRAGKAPEPALLLMVVAGFWKHNIIGIPLTAISWIIIAKGWRPALRPLLVSGAVAVGGLLACVTIFGAAFLDNLLTPRAYSWRHFLSQVGHLQWVALALLIWAAWAWSDRASRAARFTALQIGCGLFACVEVIVDAELHQVHFLANVADPLQVCDNACGREGGDPSRIRTCNPRSRNPLLYPVELWDRPGGSRPRYPPFSLSSTANMKNPASRQGRRTDFFKFATKADGGLSRMVRH